MSILLFSTHQSTITENRTNIAILLRKATIFLRKIGAVLKMCVAVLCGSYKIDIFVIQYSNIDALRCVEL